MADENNNLFNNTNEQGNYYAPEATGEPEVPETAPLAEEQSGQYAAPVQNEANGQYYSAPQDNTQQYYQPQQNAQGGQYYAPQQGEQQNYYQQPQGNQYYQAPQGGYNPYNIPMQPQEEKANKGLAALSFFVPIVGIVLHFTMKKDKPKTAKACGKAAVISISLVVIIYLICIIIGGVAASKLASDPEASAYFDQLEDYLDDYDPNSSASSNPNLSALENAAADEAQEYLDIYAFSRLGLIDQLQYEGYSESVAATAVDSLNIDWKAQAVKMANEYLESSSFTDKQDMIDQLLYEDFTQEEAEYGAENCNMN